MKIQEFVVDLQKLGKEKIEFGRWQMAAAGGGLKGVNCAKGGGLNGMGKSCGVAKGYPVGRARVLYAVAVKQSNGNGIFWRI